MSDETERLREQLTAALAQNEALQAQLAAEAAVKKDALTRAANAEALAQETREAAVKAAETLQAADASKNRAKMTSAPASAPAPSSNTAEPLDDLGSIFGLSKLPPFWPDKPALWFALAESHFQRSRIRSEDSKYDQVLQMLDNRYASEMEDIITSPPATNKYTTLKTELIRRLSLPRSTGPTAISPRGTR